MRRWLLSGLVGTALVLGLSHVSVTGTETPSPVQEPIKVPTGFTPLFNGTDMTGWHGMPHFDPRQLAKLSPEEKEKKIAEWTADAKKHWKAEKGELVNDGFGSYLTTDKDYGDCELLIEYKTVPTADSGIYLRANPQVQIWDHTHKPNFGIGADKGSGGLWNNSAGKPGKDPLEVADKPFGEWNKFRIIMVGERTTVYLNDKLVVNHARWENFWEKDRRIPNFKSGPIQLQTHGGEIRWRNIFIREIGSVEANELLRKHDAEGFKTIFNGKNFADWQGPVDNYQIVDGAIQCKPGKGGTIFTADEYQDFVARLEFKLPPGGNNGLAIRYPGGDGKADTAYQGMCEIQVLDDTSSKYAKLDARQYNGSAYGMAASHRGYLRPIGEWNLEEVTVKGSTIKVELNGTLILDADLSKITDYMAKSPHPGKERTAGHFGFAGHNDPVSFRNIQIKPLK